MVLSHRRKPGTGDSGGMNVYVRELAASLAQSGVDTTVYVRRWDHESPTEVAVEPGFRDVWVVSNVSVALLLLLTGVNVPADRLPGWMAAVGQGLPLTHAAEAARRLAGGDGDIAGPLLTEALVGLTWAVLAALLLKLFEFESRRTASLDVL